MHSYDPTSVPKNAPKKAAALDKKFSPAHDLLQPELRKMLKFLIRNRLVIGMWFAMSCDTFGRSSCRPRLGRLHAAVSDTQ